MENKRNALQGMISRREFLKTTAFAAGAALMPRELSDLLGDYPATEKLGRIAVGMVEVKSKPDFDANIVGRYYEDAVIPWYREVIGPRPWRNNQRWVETEEGFVWCPDVQPVKNLPNVPVEILPAGAEGMWVEVSVPTVDAILEITPAKSTWWRNQVNNNLPPRFYYSQILWVDLIERRYDGKIWYRINERYGNPGDLLWAPAEAFRPLEEAELAPISPDVENKQIVIDVTPSRQTMSCFEDGREVYFCRISSGKPPNSTPLTSPDSPGFNIWRKLHSIQMAGGTNEAGWMIPGIGWTTLFLKGGIAIHSTFWHNNFGEPSSHGCVNAAPDDAKWVFRWASPITPFQEGDITVSGKIGTPVKIIEY
jgi:lipoprotein-anchoring transpeptidase ErfK/SrfK